jgi:hypothetical protein
MLIDKCLHWNGSLWVRRQRSGGRTWWVHFAFTRINITPTILYKKIEDLHEADAILLRRCVLRESPILARRPVDHRLTGHAVKEG